MRLNRPFLYLSALLVLGGCGTDLKLSAITVTCDPASVVAGQPSQCTASATDQNGKPFAMSSYTWTSSNESVATVDSTGKATTLTAGTVSLSASATAGGITQQGQATLTVTPQPPRLSAVTVTCNPASVPAGRPSQCTASATDQYGQPFAVSSYTWTSSNESVATVGSTGRATTFTAGSASLSASATVGGLTQQGQATLTATAAQPTLHSTPITANETWREADNPHVVTGSIEVNDASAPTLTLEAGVQIRFEQDAELRITGGVLRAMGTQEAPIYMMANQSIPTKGYWRGVVFAGGASASELNYVTLNDCGGNTGSNACIAMNTQAAPVLRQVTVRNSATAGVALADDGSAFGSGSTTLSVSGSEGYAVRIGANQAGTLPTGGTFTGNVSNAIELRGNVTHSQTWPNLGIPYAVSTELNVSDASAQPVLTLSAGTVVRFGAGTGLRVGYDNPGGLIVDGTAAAPVLFTADSASPQPGHWQGLNLTDWNLNNRIAHAIIEYGGASGNYATGGLVLTGSVLSDDISGFLINDVVVRKSSQSGIYLASPIIILPGSTGLTARDNDGYAISLEPDLVSILPTDTTISGNARGAVEVRAGDMITPQTWPNLGVPYVINGWVTLGTTLTLPAGTELRFGANQGLTVYTDTAYFTGILIAKGTAEAPIRFVPDQATPTPGYWAGLHFRGSGSSQLDHVMVTHAGAMGPASTMTQGNVNVYRGELGAFITNSTISDSSACGITRSSGSGAGTTAVTTDYTLATYNNTFANNAGGAQCTN